MKKILFITIISFFTQLTFAQFGIKVSAIDFISSETYSDGLISDLYKINQRSVNITCGTINQIEQNLNSWPRGIFSSFDINGNLVNSKRYRIFSPGFPAEMFTNLNSISENSSTRLTLSGSVWMPPNNTRYVLIMQTDESGSPIKAHRIAVGISPEAYCTRKSRNLVNDVFYTCGVSKEPGSHKFLLMRHNADGSLLSWGKNFRFTDSSISSEATSVIDEANTGNVIVIGNLFNLNNNAASKKGFIAKFKSNGTLIWYRTIAPNVANQFSELNLQSIRPTENAQAFVITGSARQTSNNQTSTVILRVKTQSDVSPEIEFFKIFRVPDVNSLNNTIKQEGNDVVMKIKNGVIQYCIAATSYLADGSSQAMQILCNSVGTALQAKIITNNSASSAIDLVLNEPTGNGFACFGWQRNLFPMNPNMVQKGTLIKSSELLNINCGEVLKANFASTALSSTLINPTLFVINSGIVEEVTTQFSEGQIYSKCWAPASLENTARLGVVSDLEEQSETISAPAPIVYPNPVSGNACKLLIHSKSKQYLSIQLFDLQGRLAFNKTFELIEGENSLDIDLQNLITGLYTVKVTHNDNSVQYTKLLKQ